MSTAAAPVDADAGVGDCAEGTGAGLTCQLACSLIYAEFRPASRTTGRSVQHVSSNGPVKSAISDGIWLSHRLELGHTSILMPLPHLATSVYPPVVRSMMPRAPVRWLYVANAVQRGRCVCWLERCDVYNVGRRGVGVVYGV